VIVQKRRPDGAGGAARDSRTRRAIERVRHHLAQRFNEAVSLDELAALARLSRFHLLRAFTRHTGLPPHAYQVRLRIERACALLRSGISAAEVATRVGFADQSHFTRHFKRIHHITPGRYARFHAANGSLK
jgi:AraC-like DNA-binding protein